ncbi:flagellin [Teichococcus aestuarii]|uniref:Flagellin n=1 Tax=Teichococcus aestuarii TaxID=568898 RepID=A0A2U1V4C5_9PROT|nr:flagellin [Pseudoroseomonas aestuarii]PWC28732.1 flagellin [Pseudoroseomonas aestuarii]
MALNSVITNAGAMVALQSLNKTNDMMDTTQKRISTGYRVSDAKDDGAAFAVAQKVRGDVAGLTSANEQLGGAKGLLDTTLAGLNKVSTTMSELKGVMVKLADNKVTGEERAGYVAQFDKLTASVNNYVSDATYNGKTLLVTPKDADGATIAKPDTTALTAAKAAMDEAGLALPDLDTPFDPSATLPTLAEYMADPDNALDNFTAAAAAYTGTGADSVGDEAKVADYAAAAETYFLAAASASTASAAYDAAMTSSNINVVRNEKATSYSIDAVDMSTLKITKPAAEAGGEITAEQWATALNGGPGATPTTGSFAAAEKSVSEALVQFGNDSRAIDGQISFNKDRLDAMESGLGALIDADLAKESARMQSLTIRQQLGTTSLSTANQSPSALLSLFR